jgi:hypothetical protein
MMMQRLSHLVAVGVIGLVSVGSALAQTPGKSVKRAKVQAPAFEARSVTPGIAAMATVASTQSFATATNGKFGVMANQATGATNAFATNVSLTAKIMPAATAMTTTAAVGQAAYAAYAARATAMSAVTMTKASVAARAVAAPASLMVNEKSSLDAYLKARSGQ